MFRSATPFGQALDDPFGSPSVFGQTNNASGNSFGSQTMGSIFGGTSTGVFGATHTSPAFGHTMTAFGSSTPAFGSSSSSFGPSIFGQQPAFGSFGSTASPFNTAFQQTQVKQSAFGSSAFGSSTSLGASSQPTFVAASSPTLGAANTPVFGATTTPACGSTLKTTFGSSGATFGVSSAAAYGLGGSHGASSTLVFSPSIAPAFGSSSTPTFGAAFGPSSTPAFSLNPAFGQSTSTLGSGLFGNKTSSFGTQSIFFGAPTTASVFGSTSSGHSAFGDQRGGSRIVAYTTTAEVNDYCGTEPGKLASVSAMSVYKDKSHEELRWDDHQFGDKGAPTTASVFGSTCSGHSAFGDQRGGSRIAAYTTTAEVNDNCGTEPAGKLASVSAMSVYIDKSHEELRWDDHQFGDKGAPTTGSVFGSTCSGHSAFGDQRGGSRIAAYTTTAEVNGNCGTEPAGKLVSVSAMSVYKDKSHEELRWDDYQFGDKGAPATPLVFGSTSFGHSAFGDQRGGSRIAAHTTTAEVNGNCGTEPAGKLASVSAMSVYKVKSHEELRWDDYQFGDKGGPNRPVQSAGGNGFVASNPFAPKTSVSGASGFGPFGTSSTAIPFGTISSYTTSIIGVTSSPAFQNSTTSSIFSAWSSPALNSSSSIFSPASVLGTTPASGSGFGFANTLSSPLFQSAPSLGQTNAAFEQTSAPSFSQSSISSTPSTVWAGNFFSGTLSPVSTSNQVGFGRTTTSSSKEYFQPAHPAQTFGIFSNSNFGQTSAASSSCGGISSVSSQGTFTQVSAAPSTGVVQRLPVSNPFGTLPAIPQKFVGRFESAPLIQYRISSMPVPSNDEGMLGTPRAPRAYPLITPRKNPRALIIRHTEQWLLRANAENKSPLKDAYTHVQENSAKSSIIQEQTGSANLNFNPNVVHDGHSNQKEESFVTHTGKVEITYEHRADVEVLMPKLRHPDYYTEPQIEELSAMEKAEPGFCCHVKDFVVGRCGYGSIKFHGETDVRQLDLESIVQFNNREVIVYIDESKKPPVGQGLNKTAEVTLLNVKCFNKKTGEQYMDGPKVNKYCEMLIKTAKDQGAEFVSYDPVTGEWKFRVQHFSKYELRDDDKDKTNLDRGVKVQGPALQ